MRPSRLFSFLMLCVATPLAAQQVCPAGNPLAEPDPAGRYALSEPVAGQRVVVDSDTGLMWKHCPEGRSGADCGTGSLLSRTWTQALGDANVSTHAGFSDWRLPNIIELQSLVETGCHSPAINIAFFPATGTGSYWSATTIDPAPAYAYVVLFDDGVMGGPAKTSGQRVRLVRGGLPPDDFAAEAATDVFADGFEVQPPP